MSIELLLHEELLAPKRQFDRILSVKEIPLLPRLFEDRRVYTTTYVDTIVAQMPSVIQQDIVAITRVIGSAPPFTVDAKGLVGASGGRYNFDTFTHVVDPKAKTIDVWCFSTNIGMHRRQPHLRPFELDHPLPGTKQGRFLYQTQDTPKFAGWYSHNTFGMGFEIMVYMRNFAIAFNNVGVKTLQ